ncbi:Spo11/DNA topoisomerase VI subunit A [Nemania diffusa]|nr:Spo11/DNA topoisomerase VI subunit A [Nemania diffusa]
MEHLPDPSSSTFGSSSPLPTVECVNPGQNGTALVQDPMQNSPSRATIAKIEEILVANLDALAENRVLTIPIRNRRTGRLRLVRFPSSRDTEAKKFTALLQILHLSHKALVTGTVITKRAIYYQNPELFGSQQYVDELVDDIAYTFGLGRDSLNIVAASKGLVAGDLSITINDGTILYCNPKDSQGVLLPDARAISSVSLGASRWLLVIEKEATFRGLVASRFNETAAVGQGVLITAKGYPDLSTRQFLHKLSIAFPTVPMYGLVDFDPDGIKILVTYKNGSRSLQHEENATLNRLLWIGPRSDDILGHHHRRSPSSDSDLACMHNRTPGQQFPSSRASALPNPSTTFSPIEISLPLKATDRKLAVRLLSATVGKYDAENLDFIRELQVMLLLNTKAEIQAVDEAGDLTAWLDDALIRNIGAV